MANNGEVIDHPVTAPWTGSANSVARTGLHTQPSTAAHADQCPRLLAGRPGTPIYVIPDFVKLLRPSGQRRGLPDVRSVANGATAPRQRARYYRICQSSSQISIAVPTNRRSFQS
jgi:hypothetical protein